MVPPNRLVFAKLGLVLVGLFSICWSVVTIPYFETGSWAIALANAARRADWNGSRSDVNSEPKLERAWRWIRPAMSSYAIMIQIGILERFAGAKGQVDNRIPDLIARTRQALAHNPNDSFSWLALFWLCSWDSKSAPPRCLDYLRMSYRVGPNEGWIAERRNALAHKYFHELPLDLREAVATEFNGLVNSSLFIKAADLFIAAPSSVRENLAVYFSEIEESRRNFFFLELRSRGLTKLPHEARDDDSQRPDR